ncbi:MAG: MBL fold metallo-hydrolase, partial [Spirochaetaceae bacterium]|nr:MBL fold metallo-hydrolase [Spirochaetaceae bacterium]
RFLELNAKAPVYLRRGAFEPHYWKRRFRLVDVGLKPLESGRLRFLDGPVEPAEGLAILPAARGAGFVPTANRASSARKAGRPRRDDFSHEALLSIEENGRLCVFTGCSHSGVTNMMETARRASGGLPIKAVVGGMHLFHSPLAPFRFARDMRRLAADLAAHEGARYYTGHCSVEDGYARLKAVLGDRITRIASGRVLVL